MGHYDDIREAHDHEELKKRAERNNLTVEDQLEYENVFLPARKVFLEEKEKQRQIAIYNQLKRKYDETGP